MTNAALQRRSTQRLATEIEIGVHGDTNFYSGFSANIGEGGIFVATYEPHVIGQRLHVRFRLPDVEAPLEAKVEVRWLRAVGPGEEGTPGFGAAFVALSDEARAAVERFVAQREPLFFEPWAPSKHFRVRAAPRPEVDCQRGAAWWHYEDMRTWPYLSLVVLPLAAGWFFACGGGTEIPAVPEEDGGTDSAVDDATNIVAPTCANTAEVFCGDTCVAVASDPANCGSCGNRCAAGTVCSAGTCADSCAAGLTNCVGACVDTATSADHCGGCGNTCTAGEECTGGSCSCGGGTTDCSGVCIETRSDPANCGGCGTTCPSGEVCANGTCAASCPGGLTDCASACIDTRTDPNNCGGCGVICTGGLACIGGGCGCPAGMTRCGDRCAATTNDPNNCGGCGTSCAAGEICSGSTCVAPADGGIPDVQRPEIGG
jgi:uncharacterized protein (TIGR02266 family)